MAATLIVGLTATGGGAVAQDIATRASTPNLEYGDVLKIRVPYGLCEFEEEVPAYVVRKLSDRRDWARLVDYMLVNCPELGLPIADTVTASISGVPVSSGGDGGASPGARLPVNAAQPTGVADETDEVAGDVSQPSNGDLNAESGSNGGGEGRENSQGGNGEPDSNSGRGGNNDRREDGDNGHGNDADRYDESNPGNDRRG